MKKAASLLLLFFIGFWELVQCQTINHWETAVFNNDIWKYFVGTSEPDANWRSLSFIDSGWTQGPGGFGYGDNDDNTIIAKHNSVFIRIRFNVADTASIARALLSMDYDDAFVAYLNNVEIARAGITGVHPAWNQTGTDHEAKTTNTSYNYHPVPQWFIPPFDFTSSNLPIVIITTKTGETIKNEPKITADMKIIHNSGGLRNHVSDSGNIYTGKVGIEIRGMYSASLPQKPYGFETRDISGNNLDVSLLGMPPENDWVLIANYNDKTFLRNVLAFDIFHKMGNYSTRMRYCEVVLNDDYQGIYLLGEKIKQDSGRVDIAALKPIDNSGDNLTGGYIFKNDYFTATDSWKSNFSPLNKPGASVYFVYHDPKPEDITIQQKTYIQGFINSLETVLYDPSFKVPVFGYKSYIDINSFADYFVLEEVTRNVDAYKKSRYYYKNKDSKNGLLHSGPVWDMDWAWRNLKENCIHVNQTDGSGWAYRINECMASPVPPSWEVRMLQDNAFASLVHNRYFELRNTILSQTNLENTIDSVADLLNEAQVRHFQKWNILGINAGTPESGIQPLTYAGEIEKFKSWINTRLTWLDANMIGPALSAKNNLATMTKCRVFPNPVSDILYLESDQKIKNFTLFNISGTLADGRTDCFDFSVTINFATLNPGIYLLKILFSSGETATTVVVKK